MNKLLILLGIIMVIFVLGCSKGSSISGKAVSDLDTVEAPEEPKEGQKEEKAEKEEVQEADSDEEVVEAPEVPDEVKGTCIEDSLGVVRVIDENGKKEVFRNSCLGGILIDYACENNQLASKNERCSSGCEIVNYLAQCA